MQVEYFVVLKYKCQNDIGILSIDVFCLQIVY